MVPTTVRFLLAALAMSCSTPSIAQQNTTPIASGPAASPAPTANITIRGCVSGGKRYTFMQAGTGAIFELAGETSRIARVQGKLIEINATELAPQGKSDELPTLRVNTLRVVTNKCPIQARGPSKVHASAPDEGQPPPRSPATEPYGEPGAERQIPPNVNNPNISGDTGTPSPGTGNPPKLLPD